MQPESEQPTVLGCEMKVEVLEGFPDILQIKIEDVDSLGLEEEESDQLSGELYDLHFSWDLCLFSLKCFIIFVHT